MDSTDFLTSAVQRRTQPVDDRTYEQKVADIEADMLAKGLCVIRDGQCITHGGTYDLDHYLDTVKTP